MVFCLFEFGRPRRYAGLTFVGKVLKECQSLAYLNVQKYAFIDLSSDTFSHLHSLSLQWALSKKMGEVVRVTDRGIAGCDTFMRYGVLHVRRADLPLVNRGDAAAATWIFRADGPRRRHADIPRRSARASGTSARPSGKRWRSACCSTSTSSCGS